MEWKGCGNEEVGREILRLGDEERDFGHGWVDGFVQYTWWCEEVEDRGLITIQKVI